MTCYVDNARIPYRGMLMSHLIADTPEELWSMAGRLGLRAAWAQHVNTWQEHFDISQTKRAEAIRYGAVEVTQRELVRILRDRR